jgi:hypothetical protein
MYTTRNWCTIHTPLNIVGGLFPAIIEGKVDNFDAEYFETLKSTSRPEFSGFGPKFRPFS